MNDDLIRLLLNRLNAVAAPVFSPAELPGIPHSAWDELHRAQILRRTKEFESINRDGKLLAVRRSGDLIFGFDEDEEFPRPIPLTEADLVMYRLNLSGFLDAIRERNQIRGSDAAPWHGFYQVGRCDIEKIGRVTVYLSLQNFDPAETQRRLAILAGESGTKIAAFPVWPTFDTFAYVPQALYIAEIMPDLTLDWPPELVSGPPVAPRAMICNGSTWTIRFEGVEKSVNHSKGMNHIAFLLRHPGIPIPAEDVENREPPGEIDLSRAAAEFGDYEDDKDRQFSVTSEGSSFSQGDDPSPEDRQRIKLYKSTVKQLRAEGKKKEARALEKAYREMQGIDEKAIAVADKVRQAIKRAYVEIEKKHPAAYEHIEPNIEKGLSLMYRRPPDEAWEVEFS